MFGKRWYDTHPKVSLAVGCIENANDNLRSKLSKLIIKHAKEFGIRVKRPAGIIFRRWYDKNKDLSLAMEYFKKASEDQRVEIADHIIFYVREKTL